MALDRNEIRNQLAKLPNEASVVFAYRCALRALPLLAYTGSFDYWDDDQEKHLFAIFRVLDGLEGLFHGFPFDDAAAASAAAASAASAAAAASAAYAAAYASASASASAAAADAAAYAAYAYAYASAYAYADATASASASAAEAYRRFSLESLSETLEKSIALDLSFLKKGKPPEKLLEEPLWETEHDEWTDLVTRFEEALAAIDLDFWVPIFRRRFQSEAPNMEALKQRRELPEEIKNQGHRAAIQYLESLQLEEVKKLKEVKVVFLGDGGAGKTSLIHRIMKPKKKLPKDSPPTPGVDIHLWPLKVEEIQAHLWDFGGQVIMHATHQFFMSKRSVYVIVLDGRREQNPDYWLHHAQTFGGDSPVLVVINKTDEHQEDLERNTLLKKYPNIQGFFPMSCKDNDGVQHFVKKLQQALKTSDSWNTALPSRWYAIKQQLQKRPEPYITLEAYRAVCSKEEVEQEEKREVLLRHLNDLGVVVHFDELAHLNTYVLNPRWLTKAVYRVINSEALKASAGIIALGDLEPIFCAGKQDVEVPEDKHQFIMEIMEMFELAFPLNRKSSPQAQRYLIPDLLKPDEPEGLDFSTGGAMIRFRFSFPFLPTSVMARFIVRTAEDIDGKLRWRSGVVLKNTSLGSCTLIKADNDQRTIKVWVRGQQQRDHFAQIRDHFHKIFHSYADFKYREEVPLTEDGQFSANYADLLGQEAMGKDNYVLGELKQEFDLKALLNGIESEDRRQASQASQQPFRGAGPFNVDPIVEATEPIFISYSRADGPWLDRLLVHLDALEHQGIGYWYDKNIQAGAPWNAEIEQAVRGCKVAIFLVSKASLQSKFIREKEVPILQEHGIKIIPILVDKCSWGVVGWLKALQFVNDSPLTKMQEDEWDDVFIHVVEQVNQSLTSSTEEN